MSRPGPTTFTFFRKLPPEIRVMIYKLMIPGPRRVHMTFRSELPTRLGSSISIPAVLHLNREARYEALKHYKLQFGTDTYDPNVYFNPKIDALYFGPQENFFHSQDNPDYTWLCQDESGASSNLCRRGCGHHELEFFLKNIASGCAATLHTIGLDLRITQADFLYFFNGVGKLDALKKVTVYHPRAQVPGVQNRIEGSELFGVKWWLVSMFKKRYQNRLEMDQVVLPVQVPPGNTESVHKDEIRRTMQLVMRMVNP